MKIAKVNHTRSAVTVTPVKNEGIFYEDPKKSENPVINLGDHYDSLSQQAEGLYSILNPVKGKEMESVRELRNNVNRLIKTMLELAAVEEDFQKTAQKQLALLNSSAMKIYVPKDSSLSDSQIEGLINRSLRKALKVNVIVNGERCYLPDVLKGYLKGLKKCRREEDFRDLVNSIGADKILAFLNTAANDRIKPNRKKNTIVSIENQTVRVKVVNEDNRNLLVLSNADHPKKGHIFSFMKMYVAGSEEDKAEMIIRMRKLLVLYLRGGDNIDDIQVNEKNFCNELTADDILDEKSVSILDKIHQEKMEIDEIKEKIDGIKEELDFIKNKKLKNEDYRQQLASLKVKKNRLEDDINKCNADVVMNVDEALKSHFRATLTVIREKSFLSNMVNMSSQLVGQQDGNTKFTAERFWLDYFDKEARKILLEGHNLDTYKLGLLWLGKRIWNNWTSYIAQKFVDYGKAVYHFVLPEEFKLDGDEVKFGEVLPEYRDGISSFEYERVKAKENVERSTAIAVTFAANTFSRAVLKEIPMKLNERTNKMEPENDILFIDKDTYGPALYNEAGKRLLRYFGGYSNWAENEDIVFFAEDEKGVELIEPVRLQLKNLRNESFHYTSAKSEADTTVIRMLYDQEEKNFSKLVRDKYYSNNVYRYYDEKDVRGLIGFLYEKNDYVPSQVPAFNRLFNRESAYIHKRILMGKARNRIAGKGSQELTIFKGTLFFLLKEVYYHAFLQDLSEKNRFISFIRGENVNIKVENEEALADFRNRIELMGEDVTLGEICQQIMTDYELQNQNKRVYKSGKNDREKYKHYRTLLYLYLRETFVDYFLKSENADLFRFIRNPLLNEKWSEISQETYLSGLECKCFNGRLVDDSMLKWYTLAHFLTPKQLNHLIGSYKSYEVYINDIERRADYTGNRTKKEVVAKESSRVKTIIEVLTFSLNFCARTTNIISDYFENDEEYAGVLSLFVDLDKKCVSEDSTALKIFCDKEVFLDVRLPNGKKEKKKQRIGIYYDALHPVINRNVILALMYGDLRLLSATCDKVTEKDMSEYYKKQLELTDVFKLGVCNSKEQQKTLREFQNKKNYIEFHDLLSFTEMVSDLNGQLVNWSYFRERDLMYMQLGVQYTKLFFTNAVPEEDFRRKIVGNGFAITEGAILYQITAMYNYGLPLYGFDKKGKGKISVPAGVSSSGCISGFIKGYCKETFGNPVTYNEGLFFFENIGEHDEVINTRNYIDHFKYYSDHERSLLDLYSEVYERLFNYSVNYKKSVSYILPNILERYFVTLNTEVVKRERIAHSDNETMPYTVAGISTVETLSGNLTYKVKNESETQAVTIPARTEQYLKIVQRILEYKI